ncbi:MAG: homoserine dehydrogenase [Magnetococcales bacterium]|nr:homoserine dehydrogenase [Magnetococcales bacterium]
MGPLMELRIGLLGLGTVGSGVVRLLQTHAKLLEQRSGVVLRLVRIATKRIPGWDRGFDLGTTELTDDVTRVVGASDIDVCIELIGGIHPARDFITTALQHGQHVVTANKALIAEHGNELFALAQQQNIELAFEAAVAGAIPIIRVMKEGLVANQIEQLYGILNGTCNYILTEMREKGLPFDQVLAEAQRLGYAEADPTLDIDGIDAAHKLAILAAIAFGTPVAFHDVTVEGIRHVSDLDIYWAREMGYRIKLLGIAKQSAAGLDVRVQPVMINAHSTLAAVDGVFNAVFVQSDFAGSSMYYGRGAGEKPTASAVVSDLVDLARNLRSGARQRVASLSTQPQHLRPRHCCPVEDRTGEYYLRLLVRDRPGVLAEIATILKNGQISLKIVHQHQRAPMEAVPLIIVTHETSEQQIQAGLKALSELESVLEPPRLIRIEHLGA